MSEAFQLRVSVEGGEQGNLRLTSSQHSLAQQLSDAGLPLNTRCGQRGLCKGCEVELREGAVTAANQTHLAPALVKACLAHATEPLTIHVPARSRLDHRAHVGDTFSISVPHQHQPLFPVTPGVRDLAFAVDIGTTTVVVMIVDLVSGDVLARAGAFNEQIRFGDNVLTRIEAARSAENLDAMQRAIVGETIVPLLRRACERGECSLARLAGGAIAGNTTMLHLLVGEDPSSLGVAPFTPRFLDARRLSARDLGLAIDDLAPDTPIHLLPGIAGYIGADITAGIHATGMAFDTAPSLLVDIGTNGELVLQSGGEFLACATAAGPAFEGSGLRAGTRARTGAISDLRVQMPPFAIEAEVIDDVPLSRAHGLCGSAYVDFLATARASGLLTPSGRFAASVWNDIPAEYRDLKDGERALRLHPSSSSALRISEVDVALLLQAKAAIGAGVETLLRTAGLQPTEITSVYLAGGFGMHLNVPNAIAIGLLPGFAPEQVRVVGNTALAGAMLAVTDRDSLDAMDDLRSRVRVIELNLADHFEDTYIEHLLLP